MPDAVEATETDIPSCVAKASSMNRVSVPTFMPCITRFRCVSSMVAANGRIWGAARQPPTPIITSRRRNEAVDRVAMVSYAARKAQT
ncbi:MAG: hypothetical protein BWY66_01850 [bacterium ADurb.Bin374]|nr:MAG: hypothetical protein BWY66_01850 [bacterium ADurb.Bin374]